MEALARRVAEEYCDKRDEGGGHRGLAPPNQAWYPIQRDGWKCRVFTLQVLLAHTGTML